MQALTFEEYMNAMFMCTMTAWEWEFRNSLRVRGLHN